MCPAFHEHFILNPPSRDRLPESSLPRELAEYKCLFKKLCSSIDVQFHFFPPPAIGSVLTVHHWLKSAKVQPELHL